MKWLGYTADVEPGMSGGAVTDAELRLVDVISARFHQMSAGSGAHALQEFLDGSGLRLAR